MNIKLKLIEEWRHAWKYISIQLAALTTIVAAMEPFVPQLHAYLPDYWVAIASGAILVARMVQQAKVAVPPKAE
jgi:hypothetical protein